MLGDFHKFNCVQFKLKIELIKFILKQGTNKSGSLVGRKWVLDIIFLIFC